MEHHRDSKNTVVGVWIGTILAMALTGLVASAQGPAQRASASESLEQLPRCDASNGGQRDFDFNFGVWKTHVSRLPHPFSSTSWVDYDGTSVVTKIWGGRASLFELEVDGPTGHIEGAGIRLYNPQSCQWNLNWTSSSDGALQPPMYGQFSGGRGDFIDHEVIDGRNVLARNSFSDIKPDSARFEQAYSLDGGRTYQTNWVMTFTRAPAADAAARTGGPPQNSSAASAAPDHGAAAPGQRDFDFALGTWKTHIKRLKDPLSGSSDWLEYEGTHTIRAVWSGRANLGELEADGPAGHIEAVSPRYFDPQTHLWRVSYASPRDGSVSSPRIGEFKNGRGEFFGQDTYKGRTVLVRETYSPIDAATRKFEIAYSVDGGQNWETNWIMTDTLLRHP